MCKYCLSETSMLMSLSYVIKEMAAYLCAPRVQWTGIPSCPGWRLPHRLSVALSVSVAWLVPPLLPFECAENSSPLQTEEHNFLCSLYSEWCFIICITYRAVLVSVLSVCCFYVINVCDLTFIDIENGIQIKSFLAINILIL